MNDTTSEVRRTHAATAARTAIPTLLLVLTALSYAPPAQATTVCGVDIPEETVDPWGVVDSTEARETVSNLVGPVKEINCTDPALPEPCPGVPVATGEHPNGSTWILWLAGRTGELPPIQFYASWNLGAATLNNGADGYAFGAAVVGRESQGVEAANVWHGDWAQAADCKLIGSTSWQVGEIWDFAVQGGAYGYSGTESCSHTFSMSMTAGVEVGVTGPSGYAEVELGESVTCGTSTTFDSELIFGERGTMPIFSLEP